MGRSGPFRDFAIPAGFEVGKSWAETAAGLPGRTTASTEGHCEVLGLCRHLVSALRFSRPSPNVVRRIDLELGSIYDPVSANLSGSGRTHPKPAARYQRR
jgi:hypothetical protein